MTEKLDEAQLRRREMVKLLRVAVRAKHSVMADRELNDLLPAAEKAFDKALQRGTLKAIDVESIVTRVTR